MKNSKVLKTRTAHTKRAVAIDETSVGKDHPTVATRLNKLAQLLKATNRLSEAEPLLRRSLAIDESEHRHTDSLSAARS